MNIFIFQIKQKDGPFLMLPAPKLASLSPVYISLHCSTLFTSLLTLKFWYIPALTAYSLTIIIKTYHTSNRIYLVIKFRSSSPSLPSWSTLYSTWFIKAPCYYCTLMSFPCLSCNPFIKLVDMSLGTQDVILYEKMYPSIFSFFSMGLGRGCFLFVLNSCNQKLLSTQRWSSILDSSASVCMLGSQACGVTPSSLFTPHAVSYFAKCQCPAPALCLHWPVSFNYPRCTG